jgi:cytochrome c oxidase subunit 2
MRADRPGTYYGQCNQICGINHWFMPIVVRAVPQADFDAWVAQARQRFAQGLPPLPVEQAVAAMRRDTDLVAARGEAATASLRQ